MIKKLLSKNNLVRLFVFALFALGASANGWGQCTHTIYLTDTYGDGWNGGAVSVSVDGTTVLTNITLASGSGPQAFTFSASAGQTIRVWQSVAGSYANERRVQILNGQGITLINPVQPVTGTATTGGHTATASCLVIPAGSCAHTINLTDTYGDGWNGGAVSVSVNGTTVLTNIALLAGSGPQAFTFAASSGQTIRVWQSVAGSYANERRVQILNGDGAVILATVQPLTGTATTNGHTATAGCPCTGTPTGGTASVSPTSGSPNSAYTVSATGYTASGPGITYQWQSNTNGAGWVNASSETSTYSNYAATAPSASGSVQWRLAVKCSNSGATGNSSTPTFTVNAECASSGSESTLTTALTPTASNQQVGGTVGIGPGSRKIYSGFSSCKTYNLYVNTGGGPTNCASGRWLNASGTALSSWFSINYANGAPGTYTNSTPPTNATQLEIKTGKSSWVATSALLNYRYSADGGNVEASGTTPVTQACYSTVGEAFAAINAGEHQGAVIVKIKANTTETASAILNASGTGGANYTSVNMYPTANVTVSGNINAPLIDLNGADNVTIDGRLNGSGAVKNLTLSNTNTGTSVSTIRFILSAQNNVVKNCIVQSSSRATSAGGTIFFSTATAGTGNSNNQILDNTITTASATVTSRPNNSIYSAGTADNMNADNTISGNHFVNIFRQGATAYGIRTGAHTTGWTISNNHFYQNVAIAPTGAHTYLAIDINSAQGNGFVIDNNFIGGSAASAGGGAFTINGTGASPQYGIRINASAAGTPSIISNNVVRNFYVSTTHNTGFTGIIANGAGEVNVTGNTVDGITLHAPVVRATVTAVAVSGGTIDYSVNDIIPVTIQGDGYTTSPAPYITFANAPSGGTTATGTAVISGGKITGITVTNTGAGYTAATVAVTIHGAPLFTGIYITGAGAKTADNNTVSGITTTGAFANSVSGIYCLQSAGAGNKTITNNILGHATNANSIHASNATAYTSVAQLVYGITSSSTAGVNTISGNTIANITNKAVANAAHYTRGINISNGANTVENNIIRDISSASVYASATTNNGILVGIQVSSAFAGTQTIRNNVIRNLSQTHATGAVKVKGIHFQSLATGSHTIENNFIQGLTANSTHASAQIWGMQLASGSASVSNNIINVGTGVNNGNLIYGIWEAGTATNNNNIYHNTVLVSGSTSNTSADRSFAFFSNAATNTKNIRNNIFHNARSGGAAASNQNFAVRLEATGGHTINYNDYFASGNGGTIGQVGSNNHATLTAWAGATAQDANSYNVAPDYKTTPPSTAATDYELDCGQDGVNGLAATDYATTGRANPPTIGAFEAPIVKVTMTDLTEAVCNGSEVTLSGTVTATGPWTINLSPSGTATGTGNGTWSATVVPGATETYTIDNITAGTCTTSGEGSSAITLPVKGTALSTTGVESATCRVKGNSTVHFYNTTAPYRYIGAVNPQGKDLGDVTMTSYVGSPKMMVDCDEPANTAFHTAYMGRTWTMTASNYLSSAPFGSDVTVTLPFSSAELTALNTDQVTLTPDNPGDGIGDFTTDMMLTKISGGLADGQATFAGDCGASIKGIALIQGSGTSIQGISANYIAFNVGEFSEFLLNKNNGIGSPLPITLTSFAGSCNDNGVQLSWVTATETNVNYYEIYRSRDGQVWDKVTEVTAVGNSSTANHYQATDERGIETMYYKLRSVDNDGTYEDFNPVSVRCDIKGQTWSLHPVPATTQATITIETDRAISDNITIMDMNGRAVQTQAVNLEVGVNYILLDVQHFAKGTYMVKMNNETEYKPLKLMKID